MVKTYPGNLISNLLVSKLLNALVVSIVLVDIFHHRLFQRLTVPMMEYCCHLWAGAAKAHLSLLERVEKRAKNLIGQPLAIELQPLPVRCAIVSLFYRYYFGRCSSALSESVPKPKVFSRSSRSASPLTYYHVHQDRVRTISRSSSFFVRTAKLWNQLPLSCFPVQYNLGSFKRRANRFLKDAVSL